MFQVFGLLLCGVVNGKQKKRARLASPRLFSPRSFLISTPFNTSIIELFHKFNNNEFGGEL